MAAVVHGGIVKTWIALLRGINVGGARMLPMKRLVAVLEGEGYRSVRTYIQSGNVVFQSSQGTARTVGTRIAQLIQKEFEFDVPVMTLSDTELSEAIRNNPFPLAVAEPRYFHACFLAEKPSRPDLASLTQLKTAKEEYALKGRVFYMYTPDGAGNSKLASGVERALGVDTTCRNWRTLNQLQDMSCTLA
jgi:uncharacterized protein (DUF1697 family)